MSIFVTKSFFTLFYVNIFSLDDFYNFQKDILRINLIIFIVYSHLFVNYYS